ncbi:MAG: hypothetical protein ABR598_01570 [Candidatus Dormibacteria bacterium]
MSDAADPVNVRAGHEVTPSEAGIPKVANVPVAGFPQQITISAGTAFKAGFFAFWGFLVAALVPWLLVLVLGGALLSVRPH